MSISDFVQNLTLKEIEELKEVVSKLETLPKTSIFSFSKIKESDLEELGAVLKLDNSKFDEWFESNIELSEETETFLQTLLEEERDFISRYNEEDLKARFLIPILNRVNFRSREMEIREFYEESISYKNEKFFLNGTPDFFVSKGVFKPEAPYFFIQEFKRGKENSFPEPQLVAEMVAGLEISKLSTIRGAYVRGEDWNFVILEKVGENYHYFVSDKFNSKRESELSMIYRNLLFIKNEILKLKVKTWTRC
jgi:hypothetical protein